MRDVRRLGARARNAEHSVSEVGCKLPLDANTEAIEFRLALARRDNDRYARQLLTLALRHPDRREQCIAQLNQYEDDKARYRAHLRRDVKDES
jgi:hypothetical protein